MPFQRLFTHRDQRTFHGVTKEELMTRIGTFLRQAQFYQTYPGPYQVHAEQYYQKIGLRRVVDIWAYDAGDDVNVALEFSATLGDAEAAVGLVGAVLLLPVAAAVGAVSYLDYEQDAGAMISSLWSYLYSAQGSSAPSPSQVRCGNCGLELDEDSRFCKRCGAQVN